MSTFKVTTLVGQAIGGVSLFLGFGFFLLGLAGSLDLIIESTSIKAKMMNASPGVVFIIVGMFILWRYKPKSSTAITEERIIQKYDNSVEPQFSEEHISQNVNDEKSSIAPIYTNYSGYEMSSYFKELNLDSHADKIDNSSESEMVFEKLKEQRMPKKHIIKQNLKPSYTETYRKTEHVDNAQVSR